MENQGHLNVFSLNYFFRVPSAVYLSISIYISIYLYTVGEISIERVNFFLSTYISKDAIHCTFLPDIGINSNIQHLKRNRNIQVLNNSYVELSEITQEKSIGHAGLLGALR